MSMLFHFIKHPPFGAIPCIKRRVLSILYLLDHSGLIGLCGKAIAHFTLYAVVGTHHSALFTHKLFGQTEALLGLPDFRECSLPATQIKIILIRAITAIMMDVAEKDSLTISVGRT